MDFRTDAVDNIGGTQFHVKDLVEHARRENNVFVLARDGQMLRLTAYFNEEQMTFSFPVGKKPEFQSFRSEALAQAYRTVLTAFSIDIVHVHHISGLSFDIITVTKELGIRLILTLHDYYYVCPGVKLLENGSTYCHGQGKDCAGCMHNQLGYAPGVDLLPRWQETCRQMLQQCDVLIAPSHAAKEVYASVYPELAERIRVIYHGMDAFDRRVTGIRYEDAGKLEFHLDHVFQKDYVISGWVIWPDRDSRGSEVLVCLEDKAGHFCSYRALPESRPDMARTRGDKYLYCGFRMQIPDGFFETGELKLQLVVYNAGEECRSKVITCKGYTKREKNRKRIAFLGGLNVAKGSDSAFRMIQQSANRYDWYIIGGVGDPNLMTLDKKNVFKTNWYHRENVVSILQQNRIDLVCILPIWPETFCYTVSETQLAGIPVLLTDMGALKERLQKDRTGWMVSYQADAKAMLQTIEEIFADEDGYMQISKRLESFNHRSIDEMWTDYETLYAEFEKQNRADAFDTKAVFSAYAMGQVEETGMTGLSDGMLIRRVNELEATLNTINQSLEYRMVKFFNREKMPGKKLIKKLIGFAYRVYIKFFRR